MPTSRKTLVAVVTQHRKKQNERNIAALSGRLAEIKAKLKLYKNKKPKSQKEHIALEKELVRLDKECIKFEKLLILIREAKNIYS